MNKLITFIISLIVLAPTAEAQTQREIGLSGEVEDGFLKIPLSHAKVSICNADSSVLMDSAAMFTAYNRDMKPLFAKYTAKVMTDCNTLLVHAMLKGYDDVWQRVSIGKQTEVEVPTIGLRKMRDIDLSEVVVKATKVKMFYKGDTLVYNADAFKLPDGSMLDALIRQLPGVTMDAGGQIFVNGRKVDELLLGSHSFMRGNKKVLMENLPYYTVKNLKVYEKQSDMSEALGYDVAPRTYVMDVNLKNEYSQGYIANVEAAGGTEDRWLARGFLLGFTDLWRFSVMANANNVNESRHIGEQGRWTPATMPQSLLTTCSVATDLYYQSKDKKTKNNLTADYTSAENESQMRRRYEQFLGQRTPVSLTESSSKSDNWKLKLGNELYVKKPYSCFITSNTHFDYEKWNTFGGSNFEQWDGDLTASMRTDAIGKGRKWHIQQDAGYAFNIDKEKQSRSIFHFSFIHKDSRSWLSDRFDTWQHGAQTNDIRHNAADVSDKETVLYFSAQCFFRELFGKINFGISDDFNTFNKHTHDYLYHPDTLALASQLDMLTVITDPSNSYDSHQSEWYNTATITLSKQTSYKLAKVVNITYDRWRLELKVPVNHKSIDYRRGIIDTLAQKTSVFFNPTISCRHTTDERKRDLRMSVSYNGYAADMLSRIAFRDDRQPLVVKEGNSALKGTATTNANIDYTAQYGKMVRTACVPRAISAGDTVRERCLISRS